MQHLQGQNLHGHNFSRLTDGLYTNEAQMAWNQSSRQALKAEEGILRLASSSLRPLSAFVISPVWLVPVEPFQLLKAAWWRLECDKKKSNTKSNLIFVIHLSSLSSALNKMFLIDRKANEEKGSWGRDCDTDRMKLCNQKKGLFPPFRSLSVLEHGMQRKWTIVIGSRVDTVSFQMCCTICHKIKAFQHHLRVLSGTQRLFAFLPNCQTTRSSRESQHSTLNKKHTQMPPFHWGSSRAGSGPVPNLEPLFLVSTEKETAFHQEKWFQSGTRSLLGQKEKTAYVRDCKQSYCDQMKPLTMSTLLFLKREKEYKIKEMM